jgi:hypothetical protein
MNEFSERTVHPLVFRVSGSAVRAVIDPNDPDNARAEHEPEHDSVDLNCERYSPGHHVHWIQAKIGLRDEGPRHRISIVNVDGQFFTVRLADGTEEV